MAYVIEFFFTTIFARAINESSWFILQNQNFRYGISHPFHSILNASHKKSSDILTNRKQIQLDYLFSFRNIYHHKTENDEKKKMKHAQETESQEFCIL